MGFLLARDKTVQLRTRVEVEADRERGADEDAETPRWGRMKLAQCEFKLHTITAEPRG